MRAVSSRRLSRELVFVGCEPRHVGNSTSAPEADLIVEGNSQADWHPLTNQRGEQSYSRRRTSWWLPYNRQRRLITDRLRNMPNFADVPAGTVDKFQGAQAAVFFSMTTSTGDPIVRGVDFVLA